MYIKHADKHVLLSLLIHCSINESTVCGNHTRLYDIIKVIFMHEIYFNTRKVKTIVTHPVLTRRLCDARRRRGDVTTPRHSQTMSCRRDDIAWTPREPWVGYYGLFLMYCLPVLSSSCRNEMQDNYERTGKKNILNNFHLCRHTCKFLVKHDRV